MLGSKIKRLAELEQQLVATHKQVTDARESALWAQFSDDELKAIEASVERREQPGYVLTTEDKAIERRWYEAVQGVASEAQQVGDAWRAWAVAWGKAVKTYR